jgi:DNA invertase Pin-like site-specific DNA recombinase
LADLEGWSVDEVLIDNDLSAYSGACRPEYERLLDLVRRREIDVIVAYHPDRLYRRLADLVELTKVVASAGVEIRTVAAGHVDLKRPVHRPGSRGGGRARVSSHR